MGIYVNHLIMFFSVDFEPMNEVRVKANILRKFFFFFVLWSLNSLWSPEICCDVKSQFPIIQVHLLLQEQRCYSVCKRLCFEGPQNKSLQMKLLFDFGNPLHALFQEYVYLNTQTCTGERECSGTLRWLEGCCFGEPYCLVIRSPQVSIVLPFFLARYSHPERWLEEIKKWGLVKGVVWYKDPAQPWASSVMRTQPLSTLTGFGSSSNYFTLQGLIIFLGK